MKCLPDVYPKEDCILINIMKVELNEDIIFSKHLSVKTLFNISKANYEHFSRIN